MADAVEEIKLRAEKGEANAQFKLGWMYQKGKGVPQSDPEAIIWYRKAAEQEHAHACNNLGGRYARGKGVSQNYEEALYWYTKAARAGDAVAQWNLGPLYYSGLGVAADKTASYMWLTLAIENGMRSWRYRMARLWVGIFLSREQRREAQSRAQYWQADNQLGRSLLS